MSAIEATPKQGRFAQLAMIKDIRVPDAGMQDKIIPDTVGARLAEARALFERDRAGEAEALLREIASHAPAREDVAMLLAEVLRSRGRLSAAAEAMSVLAAAADFEAGVALRAAAFARECDRHLIAAQVCDAALARGAKSPDLWVLAGHVARESGDFALARQHYLKALDAGADPARHYVLGALVNTKRYVDPADPDRLRCEAQFRDRGGTTQARASAGFALAKIQSDLEAYSEAANTLREANGMAHARHPWNAAAWSQFVSMRQRENVARAPAMADPAFTPVFIVGVPRSGTTLTATLLARSTDARDRGELRALRFIAERLRSGGHLGNPAVVGEAGGVYRMLARQDDAPARVYLDQDPLNFRWLDVAAAMFPHAKVIHLRRDPRDTALSLWSQDFAHPVLAFSNDFGDIASFLRGHDALMAHWKAILDVPIKEVAYEALVGDPEGAIAELATFIGVSPVPATDHAAAPVNSASVWQARQPVYRTSVGRWRRYAPYVPELAQFGGGRSIGTKRARLAPRPHRDA